ncbi:teneurin-m isoform X1 [Diprion similis]|uniref:teneurin-m isoform X1 n=1 Tax=Diprion similis TaxID=362088 RepID=UPI001EF7C6D3|nr:teneurin-m isoform X1 [Diprion similis]XP_046748397.1 teneurin-m isoform X1 [Diprion similis]XP_046748398.1 teneurin-m isoform X1 [Diprion similis]
MNYTQGKGRLYPAYSLSGSEGEDNSPSIRGGRVYAPNNHQNNQVQHNHYNSSQHKQRAYQHPLFHVPGSGAGLSDTPTSGNASDETLTDSELTNLARDSTLLVHNGCLLDNVAPRGPPDVPPRNPTMSRLNGRLPGSHATSDHERDPDLEPSCLVRTPSGNFYNIPKIPKNEYNNKNQSTGNSPIKVELQNNMDRVTLPYGHGPSMIPMRRQSFRCQLRKGIDWCSWKLIAIVVIMLSLCLTAALTYVAASNMVNWNQGTKACTVLVGENTESKPASTEPNKTSSSRPRQQSSSGGNNLDPVYTRKRRDTPNQHAPVLHQTPQVSDTSAKMPKPYPTTGTGPVVVEPKQPESSTTISLHEDISRSVHAELSGHKNVQVSGTVSSAPKTELPYSGSSTIEPVLYVNVSSSTTNSFLDTANLTTAVDPLSQTSSEDLDPSTIAPVEIAHESDGSQTAHDDAVSQSAGVETFVDEQIEVTTEIYTDQSIPTKSDEMEIPGIPEIIPELDGNWTKNGSDSDVTVNKGNTSNGIDYPASINVNGNHESTSDFGKPPGQNRSKNVEDDIDKSSFDSKHIDTRNGSLISDNDNVGSVNMSLFHTDTKANDEVLPVALPLVVTRIDIDAHSSEEVGVGQSPSAEIEAMEPPNKKVDRRTDEPTNVTISQNDAAILKGSKKTLGGSEKAKSPGVIKETRELSREDSSSEFVAGGISPGNTTVPEKTEEPQRDYPVFSYGQDEVEIVKLDQEEDGTTVKSKIARVPDKEIKSASSLATNEVRIQEEKDNPEVPEMKRKESLQVVNAGSEQFGDNTGNLHGDEDDSENSVQHGATKFSQRSDTANNNCDSSLHEKHETEKSSNANSVTFNSNAIPEHPLTHQVHVVEVPRGAESQRSSRRILVNVTISTDDFEGNADSNKASRPLYMLSVSVPTGGQTNNFPGINISPMQLPGQPAMSSLVENSRVDETTTRIPPPPQPPTSPPPSWGGECECSCPCMESDEKDKFSDEMNALEDAMFPEFENYNFSSSYEDTYLFTSSEDYSQNSNNSFQINGSKGLSDVEESTTEPSLSSVSELNVTESTTESWLSSTLDLNFNESTTYSSEEMTTQGLWCTGTTPLPPEPTILILEGARTFPARSFPPDGTTFAQVALGQRLSKEIPPYSYWNMQFYQSEAAYVRFDYNIPRGASIGVYARRNALPTHTQYDLLEVLSGFKARTSRASHVSVIQPSIKKEATHYMEPGHWFLSLYNDDGDPQEVAFIAIVAEDMTHNCPNGCSGKGECLLGHCQCNPGFGGEDCSDSVCPVLCSQRGEYINGECQCNPGWKGKECSLRHDECEVPDCNGHGHCTNGKCNCVRGYKGKFCEEVDCPHPTCSGHGFCAEGTCICKKGWKGADCSQMDKEALQCLPDCSGHGNFDLETQTCLCEPMWSGDDCSKELCDLDCGPHGHCVDNACDCVPGWSGELCNMKQCDPRCNEHGQCKNGTCLCVTGWNGRHCTMEGCPSSCSGHGQCRVNGEAQWECRCYDGWDGTDCSVLLEQNCSDSRDNDKDGLVDCEDPECCANHHCRDSQLCVSAPKPIDILLRKQPPAITASFFERMKFLIDEGSLQNYARQETFNESVFWNHFNTSRSAVVRGQVVTALGTGLMGVRVSTSTPLEGFTLTRHDGWFDLLVNGGGAVILQFGRSPFKAQSHIVFVPWNEVIIIDKIVMTTTDEKHISHIPHACGAHDYDLMKPVVLATWKHGFQGACPDRSAILAESQVIQESLQIPGTGLNLVYHSSRAAGYLSTIQLQLTPETIPPSLNLIHLRITIEGILFEKTFEADPVIKFTYAWNRLNVYRQRVYGVTTAMVKVGYEYIDCKDVIWDVQTTKLSGHDMSISEVGGWNLDIHHRYNFHEGILQKGDGANIYLKHKPRVILTSMGDGHQRPLDCFDCDGQASKQRLLAPVALATAPDGSIFVGDFNLVRKILVDGTVKTVVRLNATRVSYRYHVALSPLDGVLYISDPESHQIIRVRDTNDYSDPEHNWETVVGSGERCLPGDEAHCGDGALARDAKLAYPKGVAVSADNVLYFADGTNIRMVDRDGIITTVIGNHMHKSHWKPIPCEGTLNVEEVHLRWPTELAINPLDNSLHMIDDHMVLQLAPDGRVKVVAGRPLHCASPSTTFDTELATHATLVMPQSIAFAPSGDLYIAESDSQRINRVRVIGTDGKISPYAGAESKCNCLERGCDCFEADHYLASSSKFNTISAVAVSPDGIVHIGDQANYRIRSVMASIPDASGAREYEIYSPDTQEIYVFNRFGQHIATKNILTGETNYLFSYNVNTSNGKLSTVTDAAGNKVFLLRDYSSQVNSIENTKGQKCRLRMSRMKMLHELSTPDNYNVTFDYHGPTGLLKTKLDSTGRSYVYNYDEFGRLTSAVTPTGKVISLAFDLSVKGATVKVGQNNRKPVSMLIKGSSVVTKVGEAEQRTIVLGDGGVGQVTPWLHTVSTDTVPYSILAEIEPLLGESYPVPAKQRTEIAGDLANRFEWRYFLRRVQGNKNRGNTKAVAQVGRKLRINGENLLSLEYDRESNTVAVFMDDRVELLNVTYDRTARPVKWGPRNGIFAGVDLEYDRFSRLTSWTWGDISETYGFDRAGRLYEIKYSDGTAMIYAFKDMFSSLPLKVTTPRGSDYLLQYDEAGALQSLTTPRGHIHAFSLQTSLGFYKYQYYSPMNRHPYEILYNDDGQILAKVYPHQSGKVAYVYDHTGKLETTLAGLSSIHYTYQEATSLVRSIDVNEPNFEMRLEYKYHAGIVKDEKIKFGSKSGMDNAHYRFQYDGNARISGLEVDINGKELPQLRIKYNQNLGLLEGVSDLRIYRNTFNRSVMQDTSKQFFTITDYDDHGRIKTVLMNIRALDVFRMELEYDNRNRIKMRKFSIGRESMMDKITYNADGHVLEVADTDNNWQYSYDENGNIVGVTEQNEKITLGYDSGDRVVQYGDVEFNSYDGRGFVVRRGEHKYRYNSRGQLIHAFEHDKFQIWYFYDDRGRLVAWNDDRGNITQYFYANPRTPDLITHVHFPKSSKTFRFLYDARDFLITVETSEQRFYVASDQNGSPLALFDTNGNLIKEMGRTPFGKIIKDTNPDFYLPIDFHGGLLDPNTRLVYLNKRLYDPAVGQWMTPAWEQMANELTTPTDIFIYRFRNNDPINSKQTVEYMTDLASWLMLYGYDISAMLGSEYTKGMVYQPSATITSPQLTPEFGVMSGLQCIVNRVHQKFSDLGFVPKPLLKLEPKTRNLLPRVAHRRAVFGEGVLVSRVGGRALVSVVDGVNSVVQDVVTSVFNSSFFLPLHFSVHDQDVFYFVKDNALKIRDDMEELRRLGGMFNVSTHETTEHGAGTWKELRLHNPDAAVVIKYGADPEQERHRILKHAHKRAVERAWEIEKQLVANGFQGRGDWTEEEKEELINHGDVDGYEGVDIHSVHRYPQLADDPGNVAFTRDTKRKRRRSGNRRNRIHRHDS